MQNVKSLDRLLLIVCGVWIVKIKKFYMCVWMGITPIIRLNKKLDLNTLSAEYWWSAPVSSSVDRTKEAVESNSKLQN